MTAQLSRAGFAPAHIHTAPALLWKKLARRLHHPNRARYLAQIRASTTRHFRNMPPTPNRLSGVESPGRHQDQPEGTLGKVDGSRSLIQRPEKPAPLPTRSIFASKALKPERSRRWSAEFLSRPAGCRDASRSRPGRRRPRITYGVLPAFARELQLSLTAAGCSERFTSSATCSGRWRHPRSTLKWAPWRYAAPAISCLPARCLVKIQLPHFKPWRRPAILATAANSKSMSPLLGGLLHAPTHCRWSRGK